MSDILHSADVMPSDDRGKVEEVNYIQSFFFFFISYTTRDVLLGDSSCLRTESNPF